MLCRRKAHVTYCCRQLGFLPAWSSKEFGSPKNVWPHHTFIDKLIAEGEEKRAKYTGFEHERNPQLRYHEKSVLKMLRKPEVQSFLNKLEEDTLKELSYRKEECAEHDAEIYMIKQYPKCLMGLDPFSYIREENRFKEFLHDERPEEVQRTSGAVVNMLRHRTPIDFLYLVKDNKLKGVGDYFTVLMQQTVAGKWKVLSRNLRNRGFDHGLSDRIYSNKKLASELQERYMKHFELAAAGKWNTLMNYVAEYTASRLKTKCAGIDPGLRKLLFHFELIQNNRPPKVLSYMHIPNEDQKYMQVLVRFDMKVRCMGPPRDDGHCYIEEMDKVQYIVFEKELEDFASTYVMVDKVSEEDLQYFKRHLFTGEALRERIDRAKTDKT